MKPKKIDYIGWAGAATSLSAFTLNSHQILPSNSMIYLILNMCACSMLITYTFHKKAYANTVLASIWLVVSLIAIIKNFNLS